MPQRAPNHVPLATCPKFRHVAHPGYTCAEEEALRTRVVAHLGQVNQTTYASAGRHDIRPRACGVSHPLIARR